MTADVDLALVGSGFGASLLAMIGRRLGLRVLLLERGVHPRFAIGESASPLAGVLVEQLADRFDLPRIRPLASYGAWQRAYPGLGCGLKRGFTYYRHEAGQAYRSAADRSNQLLVAASPSDELSDTHWLRADVDHFLVEEAVSIGADYLDRVQLESMMVNPDGTLTLRGTRAGRTLQVRARRVVDATGPRGFASRVLGLPERGFPAYPGTQALFSHFTGVARCDTMPEYEASGTPPYAPDDAALHHVFDEGWMWVLRFGNGVTSAGLAVTDRLAAELRLGDGRPAWERFLARYPSVAAQFAAARPVREFTWMPRLPYRAAAAAGANWLLLPSAAAFVDPLFSTGMPLTLLGVERIAAALASGGNGQRAAAPGYERLTFGEADHTAQFIAGCYAAFPRFDRFTAYAMCYFAAASFSEMARRLGSPHAYGFLCREHPTFGPATIRLSPAVCAGDGRAAAIAGAIEPLNIAGLCDPAKRNWYGVDLADTIRGAPKLGLSEATVRARLAGDWMAPAATTTGS